MLRTIPALTLDGLAEVPWALERAVLAQLIAQAQRGEPITAGPRSPQPSRNAGAVAIIPIHGVIEHRSSWLLELFGGTSVEDIRGMLRAALADQQVTSIVLDIDSPGGGVAGVTELASDIRAARAQKRIVAVANTTAASAAYWLGSQADQLLVSPSGQVGSIGVYAVHVDISRALDADGITPTIISAGEHKADGNEFEPLSNEARAEMQRRVDTFYATFVGDVAKGRRTNAAKVLADYGQGSVLLAPQALEAGLVDGIGTLEDALRLANRPPASARAEDEERDPDEVDLPFRTRVENTTEDVANLVQHATIRAALRAKEGRRAFSEPVETSLRSIHSALSELLAVADPPAEPPPAPAVDPPAQAIVSPASPAQARRFRSREDWARYVQEITH